jgi:hypothetical protein
MILTSFKLSQAISGGRRNKGAPASREEVLTRLLHMRAAAHRAGLDRQEQLLRDQIRWALPILASSSLTVAPERLREQADHYRRMAEVSDSETADSLRMLAEECAAEAGKTKSAVATSRE